MEIRIFLTLLLLLLRNCVKLDIFSVLQLDVRKRWQSIICTNLVSRIWLAMVDMA